MILMFILRHQQKSPACLTLFSYPHRLFTPEEVEEIRKIKLWDIIVNASSVHPDEIQRDLFFFHPGDPCPQPGQLNASQMEHCQYLQGYDYFQVGENTSSSHTCIM